MRAPDLAARAIDAARLACPRLIETHGNAVTGTSGRMAQWLAARVRRHIGESGRAYVTRVSYAAGLRPRVNRQHAHTLPLPAGYRGALIISADLELAWAWRYARGLADPLAYARQRARQGRRNVPTILDLCDAYQVPITWATVGHLFLDRCERAEDRVHPLLPRIPHFTNELWSYESGDWFDADNGADGPHVPGWADWHAPDLVRSILQRTTQHEVGSHSFSHPAFSEDVCPPEVAVAELQLCQEIGRNWGLELKSFVFPGNLAGNVAAVAATGFGAYRLDNWYDVDVPRRDALGLWQISGGVCLDRPYAAWSAAWRAADHVKLACRAVDLAIEHGLVCGLWFHPEMDPEDVNQMFPRLFAYIARRRGVLWIPTLGELSEWLGNTTAAAGAGQLI